MLLFSFFLIVIFALLSNSSSGSYNDDPFACGSDEVCYCDKAKDCKKVESKKEK
jgi:hypothetical protein